MKQEWAFIKINGLQMHKGGWDEVTNAIFTVEAITKRGYRKDCAGGADGDAFFAVFFNLLAQC